LQILGYIQGTYQLMPGISITWDLLDMELGFDSHLTQDFTFCPDIKTRLTLPTPVEYTEVDNNGAIVSQGTNSVILYNTGNDLNIVYPCFGWPQMPIRVDDVFGNDFTNHTWDSIAFWFHIMVLTIDVEIHIGPIDGAIASNDLPPLILDIPIPCPNNPDSICYTQISSDSITIPAVNTPDIDFSWNYGPLYDNTFPLGYLPLTWFNQTWTIPPVIDTLCGNVTLVAKPEMTMNLTSCNPIICWGDSTACIRSVVQYGIPPFTYSWSNGVSHTINGRIDSLTHLPFGIYGVTVSDANGCSLSDTISVIPIDPPLSLTINKVNVTCVRGSDGILTAMPQGGTPGFYYIWAPTNQHTALIGNLPAREYCVTVTDALGCTVTGCDSLIELHPRPPAHFNSDITEGCQPLAVHFFETSPDEGQTYSWDFNDGGSSTLKDPIHIFTSSGLFDVKLTVSSIFGCDSIITIHQMIDVWPKPNAKYYTIPDRVDMVDPQVFFQNLSTGYNQSYWDFGDSYSSSQANAIHKYTEPGTYSTSLIVTSDKGCIDTAYKDITIYDYWTIYFPTAFSPTNDSKNDVFKPIHHNISDKEYHFMIFDRWGQLVFETRDYNKGWDGTLRGKIAKTNTVYTWTLSFRDLNNVLRKMNGTITVFIPD
jgi:gliding motility-associated-like protein